MERATTVPKPELDEEDRKILRALVQDARASHRKVAAKTGLGLATVNRRIHRLEKSGVVRGYSARVDPEAAGWNMTAIVGLRIDKGHIREVQKTVAKDARIFGVYDVTGEWDGVVLARLRDRADLDDLAKTTLSGPHIQRTNTMVVLATVLEDAIARVP